jgi:hypothetical protein
VIAGELRHLKFWEHFETSQAFNTCFLFVLCVCAHIAFYILFFVSLVPASLPHSWDLIFLIYFIFLVLRLFGPRPICGFYLTVPSQDTTNFEPTNTITIYPKYEYLGFRVTIIVYLLLYPHVRYQCLSPCNMLQSSLPFTKHFIGILWDNRIFEETVTKVLVKD